MSIHRTCKSIIFQENITYIDGYICSFPVIRAKITSTVKFEIPKLPETPSPVVPTPGNRSKGHGQGQKISNKVLDKVIKDNGPVPIRGMAPEPRNRRSIAAPSGMGGYGIIPQYQNINIKRILKGAGKVEKTVGTTPEDKNNARYTRYFSRAYLRNPGFQFKKGKSYLLMGKIIKNKLWVSFCDWHDEWESLNLDQLRNLKKNFILGCTECRVKFCYYPGCENKNKELDVCMWRPDSYYNFSGDCRVKHSACRKVNGRCQWTNDKKVVNCKKDKENNLP